MEGHSMTQPRLIPCGSTMLSPEEAGVLLSVLHHSEGTTDWAGVATDTSTTVEAARERHSGMLKALTQQLSTPQATGSSISHPTSSLEIVHDLVATISDVADELDTELRERTTPEPASENRIFTLARRPKRKAEGSPEKDNAAQEASLADREPVTVAVKTEPHRRKSVRLNPEMAIKVEDDSTRSLDRLNSIGADNPPPRLGTHQNYCCFNGYRWCCYAEGCIEHVRCRRDVRVHFKDKHRSQLRNFVYTKVMKKTPEEAEVWANRFHEEEYSDEEET